MRPLRNDKDIEFIFLSTAGPGFCIVTRNTEKARNIFESLDMKVYIADIYNDKYGVIKFIK